MKWVTALVAIVTMSSPVLLQGQTVRSPTADRAKTAAEHAHGVPLYRFFGLVSEDRTHTISQETKEEFNAELDKQAKQWVQSLQQGTVTGIQLDASGQVSIAAHQDALARQQFTARLATPNLSLEDRAFTLLLATTSFGQEPRDTARMRIAHEYLATLDALPDTMVTFKYRAYTTLGMNYFEADESAHGISHLLHAYALLPLVPFERMTTTVNVDYPFVPLANMLAGRPNGRAQIDSLGKWVLKYLAASPEAIARDTSNLERGKFRCQMFEQTLSLVAHLGRESPPITGHAWWNTATPSTPSPDDSAARVLSLNDGKIRIIQFGDGRCGACMANLPVLDRLRKEMPKNVEVWYVSFGFGTWGADSVDRAQEAALMQRQYLEHKKLGLSFAVWLGDRQPDINGGTYPKPHPTFQALDLLGKGRPWILVTDGNGRVRYLTMGYLEDHVRRTVRLLEAEMSERTSGSASSSGSI